jgi:hypothetical protein
MELRNLNEQLKSQLKDQNNRKYQKLANFLLKLLIFDSTLGREQLKFKNSHKKIDCFPKILQNLSA